MEYHDFIKKHRDYPFGLVTVCGYSVHLIIDFDYNFTFYSSAWTNVSTKRVTNYTIFCVYIFWLFSTEGWSLVASTGQKWKKSLHTFVISSLGKNQLVSKVSMKLTKSTHVFCYYMDFRIMLSKTAELKFENKNPFAQIIANVCRTPNFVSSLSIFRFPNSILRFYRKIT